MLIEQSKQVVLKLGVILMQCMDISMERSQSPVLGTFGIGAITDAKPASVSYTQNPSMIQITALHYY